MSRTKKNKPGNAHRAAALNSTSASITHPVTSQLSSQDISLIEEIKSGLANGVIRCLILHPILRPDHPLNNEATRLELLHQIGGLCSKSCSKFLICSNNSATVGIVYLAIFDTASSAKLSKEIFSSASLAIQDFSFHIDLSKKEGYIIGQFITDTALLWRDLNPMEAQAFWGSDHSAETNDHTPTQSQPTSTGQIIYENQAVSGLSLTLDDDEQEDYEPPDIDITGVPNGNSMVLTENSHQRVADLVIDDQMLQIRYFGLDQDDVPHCLCCGEIGHMINSCPNMICESCSKRDHFTGACSISQRCTKCHSAGHHASVCPEKLKRTSQGDGITCSLCTEIGHSEENCPSIWTTFRPDPTASPPVRMIRPMCYQCGANKHWGDDCPMRDRRAQFASKSFSMNYVSLISPGYAIPPQNIPEIVEISSDEEYVPFLHERQARVPAQGITLNLSFNPSSNNMTSSRADHYSPPPPEQPSRRGQGDSYRPLPGPGRNFDRPGTNSQPPIGMGRYNFRPPLPNEPPPPFVGSGRQANRRSAPRGRGRGAASRGSRY
jgi:hypothetical protein